MNPLYVSRASQQITLSRIPDSAFQEYIWREKWSVYRLPDWVRVPRTPFKEPQPRASREVANIKAEHGQ